MKRKNWIFPGLVAFLVVAGSVTVGFSSRASSSPVREQKDNDNSTCCEKMKECKGKTEASGEILLDNLSHQFMTIFAAGR